MVVLGDMVKASPVFGLVVVDELFVPIELILVELPGVVTEPLMGPVIAALASDTVIVMPAPFTLEYVAFDKPPVKGTLIIKVPFSATVEEFK